MSSASNDDVQARGYWELVWRRFRRDKVAIASGVFIIFLILVAFGGAPIAKHFIGHGPNDIFTGTAAVDSVSLLPGEPLDAHRQLLHEPPTSSCSAARTGSARTSSCACSTARSVSLEVALLSTFGVMFIGVILGSIAGYFRGWVDTIISRITEITMAFPLLLFIVALAATVGPQLDAVTFGGSSRTGWSRWS